VETFIVRIYRGNAASANELAGTVERVGSGDRVGFSGHEQLLGCLLLRDHPGGHEDSSRTPSEPSDARGGT